MEHFAAVRLSWTKENIFLMTASMDRATKFWRLDDTTASVHIMRKAGITDAVMTNNWLLSISAYDDVYRYLFIYLHATIQEFNS